MSGACADRLAGWRAARSVASVTSAFSEVVTLPEAQKTADVASVTSVASGNAQAGDDVAARAAFYLAASKRALEALAAPDAPAWPEGANYWLTHDAAALAGILNMGGTARFCPNGGLDVWQADGRYVGFSPDLVRRLAEAELLPASLTGPSWANAYAGVRRAPLP